MLCIEEKKIKSDYHAKTEVTHLTRLPHFVPLSPILRETYRRDGQLKYFTETLPQ